MSNDEKEIMVAVERHPAYWVLTADPPLDHPCTVFSLAVLRRAPEWHLGPLRCAEGRTAGAAYSEVLDLLVSMPGVPLGLTFDGGIAVTYTDYRLATERHARAYPKKTPLADATAGAAEGRAP